MWQGGLAIWSLIVGLILLAPAGRAQGLALHGAVATVNPAATRAGLRALESGGNAIDAVVAAALTLGVVDGYNSGLGGGCFILIRLANGTTVAIDGRETAPLAARKDMFLTNGVPDPQRSRVGALAVGVPGALAAYDAAVRRYGRLGLRRPLLEAAQLAETGFVIDSTYAKRLDQTAVELDRFPSSKAVFLHADGTPRRAGELLKQPDLARTYRAIAENGANWFYGGPFAELTQDWMQKNGGLISTQDFRRYRVRFREPVFSSYRGYLIAGFPPPSSGGVHVAEILNILENFNLPRLGLNSANSIHLTAEAMKLAFADRAKWLGDEDFVRVPPRLVSKPYAAQLARLIRRDRTIAVGAGAARESGRFRRRHTTHISAADMAGNWVACTTTINTTFGSQVVVPGTGVVLNNEMDDFSAAPGATNYFGLVGSEANSIAPGKRPLSSMSPTIVFRAGVPILAVGAAGGPTIISQVVLAVERRLDFGISLETNLAMPRFHHQWLPDELKVEKSMPEAVISDLERRGHRVVRVDAIGVTEAVGVSADGLQFIGASDPRVNGQASVY